MPGSCLPAQLRRPIGYLGLVGATSLVVLGLLFFRERAPSGIDAQFVPRAEIHGPLRPVALGIDSVGEPLGAAMAACVFLVACVWMRRVALGVVVVALPAVLSGGTTLGKHLVGRTVNGNFLAYPSGHVALATALGLVAGILAAHHRGGSTRATTGIVLAAALSSATAMTWAQVVLNRHYPTDALGGAGLALVAVPLLAGIVDGAHAVARTNRAVAGRSSGRAN